MSYVVEDEVGVLRNIEGEKKLFQYMLGWRMKKEIIS